MNRESANKLFWGKVRNLLMVPRSETKRDIIFGLGKSGTTALFSSLREAMAEQLPELSFEPQSKSDFESAVVTRRPLVMKALARCLLHVNDDERLLADVQKRISHQIFITRDIRDVMVSRLLYTVWNSTVWNQPGIIDPWLELLRRKQESPQEVSFLMLLRQSKTWCKEPESMEDLVAQKLDVLIRFADSCKGALRFRYEDFVAGKVDALEDCLGFKVPVQPDVPEDLKRVERTRSSGSWRHWFMDEDLPWAKESSNLCCEG